MAISAYEPGRDSRTQQQIHAQRWWTLGALCLCLLMVIVDNTIVNVAQCYDEMLLVVDVS